MYRILLLCNSGVSTGIIVYQMRQAAQRGAVPCTVTACALSHLDEQIGGADVVLLGPQIRFDLARLQQKYPDVPLAVIPPQVFGHMDGAAALQQALDLVPPENNE